MAATFARILGTEKDRLNCPFYFRIGACRHGDRCSRNHLKPHFSQTLMIPHMYTPSSSLPAIPTSESSASPSYFDHMPDASEFADFFEDVLDELEAYGRIDDLLVVQNMGDHMHGNTYVKFRTEEEAEVALKAISGRYYRGQKLEPEYSPVTDFSEAVCGMFRAGFCERGDYCNFMHARPLTKDLRRRLKEAGAERKRGRKASERRGGDRGDSPRRRRGERDRSRSPSVGGSGGEDEERESSAERRARIAQWNAEKDREEPQAKHNAG